MTGPHDKNEPSNESFIKFACQEERDRIFNIITSKKLGANLRILSGAQLMIARSKSDWIRNKNFATRTLDHSMLKCSISVGYRTISEKQCGAEDHSDGVDAFLEHSGDPVGDLQLISQI